MKNSDSTPRCSSYLGLVGFKLSLLDKKMGILICVRMLDFVRGDPKTPCGNLILYAHTSGHNSITSNAKFIVCNVVVSFVSASEDHFPVVAFPPAILDEEEQLSALLHFNAECDVVRLEDFSPPAYQEAKHYVRARIKNFNVVVAQYVGMCREYFQMSCKEGDMGGLALLNYKPSSRPSELPENGSMFEETSCLDQLEQYIKVYETVPHKTHAHFRKIMKIMEHKYPYYDVANFARVLGASSKASAKEKKPLKKTIENPKFYLATLYLRKFRAIQEEKYEEAAKIQNRIRDLERSKESYGLDAKNLEIERHN